MSDRDIVSSFCYQIAMQEQERRKIEISDTGKFSRQYISPFAIKKMESASHISIKDIETYMSELDFLEAHETITKTKTYKII